MARERTYISAILQGEELGDTQGKSRGCILIFEFVVPLNSGALSGSLDLFGGRNTHMGWWPFDLSDR